jgi:hypothetical protein
MTPSGVVFWGSQDLTPHSSRLAARCRATCEDWLAAGSAALRTQSERSACFRRRRAEDSLATTTLRLCLLATRFWPSFEDLLSAVRNVSKMVFGIGGKSSWSGGLATYWKS